ncbi:riboflavin synthase [Sphingobium sp. DEHP117]|uniref:riboflavin synthase n=1 Tax=Sphingobium sp. DEHP117 TaxID=2993436 RepID=UPI0027D534D1|nr:riboflavin synthase [Sphingobium sp. DEHP117]MDQ4419914.1 riboflavin synthase [Sphingobium sp. DEHP117]
MFTGIITDIGTILSADPRGDLRLTIGCGYDMDGVALGASIACSGVCLTVVDKGTGADGQGWFAVDASAETVRRTAPGMWEAGRRLNLERALKLGDELGGHIVTGHVDGIATVIGVCEEGESRRVGFTVTPEIAPFIAPKGSVTVDGVSLTVNEVADHKRDTHFSVNLIPHTWSVTTLDELAEGRAVNIEIDVLARYLARMKERITVV